jgi:hypothetical protein
MFKWLSKLIRKEPEMAGEQGAAGAQIDMAAIQKTVNDTLAGAMKPVTDAIAQLAGSQKTIADALAAQATAAAPKTKEGEAKPLTAEDVTKLVTDVVTRAQQTQQASAQQQQQRDNFIASRLKNFPAAYANQLGNDPAKFEDEAKKIETAFKADAEKNGWKVPAIGGETQQAQSAMAVAPDLSKLSPNELIREGLKNSKPGTSQAATVVA